MTKQFFGLRQVAPIVVTDPGVLISSDVVEDEYAAYNAGTGYTTGQRCIADHVIYESAMATANTNNDPTLAANREKWARVSATNRHRMFDRSNQSQTTRATALSWRLRPGQAINVLYLANVTGAQSARVRMIDPVAGTVFNRLFTLAAVPLESGWWAFHYGQRFALSDLLVTDLPTYPNADVYVDLSTTSGTVGVGTCILGQSVEIGDGIRMGASLSIADYSTQEVNKYGDLELVQGAWAKKARFSLRIPTTHVDMAYQLLLSRRGLPTLWIGYAPIKSTVVFGVLRTFDILLNQSTFSDGSVEYLGFT